MAIRVYTSKNCGPCKEVGELIQKGRFAGASEVEVVDIESDDGFEMFKAEVLDHGDGAVPSAYRDGQRCEIRITEEDELIFNCPTAPPSSEKD